MYLTEKRNPLPPPLSPPPIPPPKPLPPGAPNCSRPRVKGPMRMGPRGPWARAPSLTRSSAARTSASRVIIAVEKSVLGSLPSSKRRPEREGRLGEKTGNPKVRSSQLGRGGLYPLTPSRQSCGGAEASERIVHCHSLGLSKPSHLSVILLTIPYIQLFTFSENI